MEQNPQTPPNDNGLPPNGAYVYRAGGVNGHAGESPAGMPTPGPESPPQAAPQAAPPYRAPAEGPLPGYGYGYGGAGGGTPPPPPANKRRKSGRTPMQIALLAVGMALILLVALVLGSLLFVMGQLHVITNPSRRNNTPPSGTFSVVQVVGNIQNAGSNALGVNDPSYHHGDTVAHVQALTEDAGNAGILLYLNTPGGGVYESDELYLALLAYQETTGRPVWGYMADTCASGGYYVAALADKLVANRNTITGSIGVYIALTDTSGLYEKLGIETVLVRSGDNKGTGLSGVPITDDQRAVYQSIVDEDYAVFVDIVAQGRGLSAERTRELGDGRIYSGRQAMENGLVDELGSWETTLAAFEAETGASPFYPNFSRSTALGSLIGTFTAELPQNETETQLAMAEKYPVGVPMVLYDPAA